MQYLSRRGSGVSTQLHSYRSQQVLLRHQAFLLPFIKALQRTSSCIFSAVAREDGGSSPQEYSYTRLPRNSDKRRSSRQRWQKQVRGMAAPRAITTAINAAATISTVQKLVQRHNSQLESLHVSAMLSKLVSFSLADPTTWHGPAASLGRRQGRHQASQVYTIADDYEDGTWEFSMGVGGGDSEEVDAEEEWQSYMEKQRRSSSSSASNSGREISMSKEASEQFRDTAARQLGQTIEVVAQIACERPLHFKLESLAMTLESLARLGYKNSRRVQRLLDCTLNLLLYESTADEQVDERSLKERKQHHSQGSAPLGRSESILRIVQALLTMKVQPSAQWLQALEQGTSSTSELQSMEMMYLCTLVVAFGTMGHKPNSVWLSSCASASGTRLHACQPGEISYLLSGFSSMHYQPDNDWVQQLLETTEPMLSRFSAAELTRTLSSMAAMGLKPGGAWMDSFFRTVDALPQRDGTVLDAVQLTTIVNALAQLQCRPDSAWMNECLMRSRRCLPEAGAPYLAQLISSLAALRFRASEVWVQHFLSAAFARLPFASPQQCCYMVQALAQLGQIPQGMWLQELAERVKGRLDRFSSEQLSGFANSLARLGFRPSDEWLLEWERCSGSKLDACTSSDLSDMVWALAEMGHKPQVSWLYSFVMVVYDRMDSFDAVQLRVLFDSLPRISPHPTWLDELVQICATETYPAMKSGCNSLDDDNEGEVLVQHEGPLVSEKGKGLGTTYTIPSGVKDEFLGGSSGNSSLRSASHPDPALQDHNRSTSDQGQQVSDVVPLQYNSRQGPVDCKLSASESSHWDAESVLTQSSSPVPA